MSLKDNLARIRKERKMSQTELASLVGVRQNTIAAIESGLTRKTKYLPEIAKALEVPIVDLEPSAGGFSILVNGRDMIRPEPSQRETCPVYASAQGGRGGEEVVIEPVDYAPRPPILLRTKDAYAVRVTGESMVPALRPGDLAFVDPYSTPRRDDDVVLQRDEAGSMFGIVKTYLGEDKNHYHLRQYNPKRDFKVSRKDWVKCHLIVGKYYRRG